MGPAAAVTRAVAYVLQPRDWLQVHRVAAQSMLAFSFAWIYVVTLMIHHQARGDRAVLRLVCSTMSRDPLAVDRDLPVAAGRGPASVDPALTWIVG